MKRGCDLLIFKNNIKRSSDRGPSLRQLLQKRKKRPEGRFFYACSHYFTAMVPFIIEMWPGNEQKKP